MAEKLIARTKDHSISLDLLNDYGIRGARSFGISGWTDPGTVKRRNYERTTAADRTPRRPSLNVVCQAATMDLLRAKYADLKAVFLSDEFEIVRNDGGATEADRVYDCFGVEFVAELPENLPLSSWLEWPVLLEPEARPFVRAQTLNLPRNYVKDAVFEDHNVDGYPNSFVADDSGTPATGTVTLMSDDGEPFIRIQVTGGDVGRFKGLKQAISLITVADASYEYRVADVANDAYAQVTCDSIISAGFLYDKHHFNNTTDWIQANQTTVGVLGATGGAASDLHIRVYAPNANSTMTFDIRYPQLATEALPTGKDGGKIFCATDLSTSPGHVAVKNLPGDVDGPCIIKQRLTGTVTTTPKYCIGRAGAYDRPMDSYGSPLWRGYIYKFRGSTADATDANAVGGVCSDVIAHGAQTTIKLGHMRGRFSVWARIRSTDTAGKFSLKVYPNNYASDTPYSTRQISSLVATADKWSGPFCLGTIDLPLGSDPDFSGPANTLGVQSTGGAVGAGWKIDHLVFIPVRGGHYRIDPISLVFATEQQGIIYDTISQESSVYVERVPSGAVTTSFSVGSGSGYTYSWRWNSMIDYTNHIVSVDMPDLDPGGTFSALSGGATYVDTVGTVTRFNVGAGWGGSMTGDYTFPSIPFAFDDNLPEKGNITSAHDPSLIYLAPGVLNLIPTMAFEKINNAAYQYQAKATTFSFRYIPFLLE
ncbi:MAG: hypothetical protein M0Z43_11290 [Acidithiobacillus sp.]|nr:hypothetical protein [Acidithiobacillus sp.]